MGSSDNWLKSYLSNRSFSVTSDSTSSSILPSPCGVPQCSVLGPILFTIYVSPIAQIVSSYGVNQQQYAEDAQLILFLPLASLSSSHGSLQRCVSSLHSWFLHNGLVLNPTKTEAICFGTNPRLKSLSNLTFIEVASKSVPLANHVKLLGVTIECHLDFAKHISNVCPSSYFHIRALHHIRHCLDSETSVLLLVSHWIMPTTFLSAILICNSSCNIHRLQCVQNSLARVVTRSATYSTSAFNSLHGLPIRQRIDYKLATLVHCSFHNACPQYLSSLLQTYTPTRQLRSASSIFSPYLASTLLSHLVVFDMLAPLFGIPSPHLSSSDYTAFKSYLKTHLFSAAGISGP